MGREYDNTRHNIGFAIVDQLAEAFAVPFEDKRYGAVARLKHKGRILILLKPSTFMNRSGSAINYWMKKEKTDLSHLLVILDDIALPFGAVRLRPRGGDGGHNGLFSIQQSLDSQEYARIRFGIGKDFYPGQQSDYVLSPWLPEEKALLPKRIQIANEMVLSFVSLGPDRTMNLLNPKGKTDATENQQE